MLSDICLPNIDDGPEESGLDAALRRQLRRAVMVEAARMATDRRAATGTREQAFEDLAAALFAVALTRDPQRELDWLLLYCRAGNPMRRRFCLERALAINPRSEVALAALRCMPLAD